MKIKELRDRAYLIHKQNSANNWVIAVVFVLFTCAILSLSFLIASIYIITLPLVIMPVFFAFTLFHYAQGNSAELKFQYIFRFMRLYVSPKFYGSLRFFFCYFVSLLIEIILGAITGLILFFVFKNNYNPDFMDSINDLTNNIMNVSTTEELETLINGRNNVLAHYYLWLNAISTFFGMISFATLLVRQMIYVHLKASFPLINPMYDRVHLSKLMRGHRKEIWKMYLGLNWPLFVLLTIGYFGVFTICYFNLSIANYIQTFSLLGAIGMSVFFFPFMMSNMEVISENLKPHFIQYATNNDYIFNPNMNMEGNNQPENNEEESNSDNNDDDSDDDNHNYFGSDIEFK